MINEHSPNVEAMTEVDAIKVAQILEASPNEVYLVNQDSFKVEYANPLALNNLGYALGQLQTMTVLDIAPNFNVKSLNELVAPLVNKAVTQIKTETIHLRADGSTYPIEVYLQLVEERERAYFFAIVIDISQRKNAEQSLQAKTDELASIANNIPGVIYRMRYFPDGSVEVEYVSDRVEEIIEISTETIYADFHNFLNLVHLEDRLGLEKVMRQTFSDLTPLFWEGRIITPSQCLVWVQARSQPQKQADGCVVSYGVFLDITAQKQAELALQQSEEQFRQFAENIDDIFWMIDPSVHQLFYVSPAYEKIWGISPQSVRENPVNFINAIHPDDRERMQQVISQPILKKQDSEYRIIRPNGEIRWLRDRAFPIKNQNGEVYRVAGIAQDITEQKHAEAEISRSRDLREAIFNEASDALFLLDPTSLQIVDCNRRALELSAASSKENLINRTATCLNKKPISEVRQALAEKGVWYEEVILTTLKGEKFWGDVAWKEIEVGGQTLYLVRLTDISDRKAFETELQITNKCLELTNEKLTRATRLKDEFMANMSHELKTPLNAILGMSEGLKEGSFAAISQEQKQAVTTIESSARYLLALINNILDLAKIQSGKATLSIEPTNLQSLCEGSLNFVHQQAYQKGIQLQNYINTSMTTINIDELKIRQILINLLSNAVKFTPNGGKIKLTVQEDMEQENLIFSVSDTGIGIAVDQIPQIFEPFVQLDSKLNRQHRGTGLGLSLVRRLAELHGGNVSVESELGKGSTFHVKFPYSKVCFVEHTVPYCVAQEITQLRTSFSIVIANSDRAALETISSYFEASGYEVVAVNNCNNLLPVLAQTTPQAVIIDWSSFEEIQETIIQQIRQFPQFKAVPIIILLAQESPPYLQERLRFLGANSCLQKPVRLRHLLSEIQRLAPEEFLQ